jgi:hypothetical protein
MNGKSGRFNGRNQRALRRSADMLRTSAGLILFLCLASLVIGVGFYVVVDLAMSLEV